MSEQPRLSYRYLKVLETIIQSIGKNENSWFEPEINDSLPRGFTYPQISDVEEIIGAESIVDILEELRNRNLLEGKFHSKILYCPSCGSFKLRPSTACRNCGSQNIQKKSSFMHTCGAVLSVEIYGKGGLCPKCGDPLRPDSMIEYKPVYVCEDCGELFEEPKPVSICQSCGALSNLTEVKELILNKYKPTELAFRFFEKRVTPETFAKTLMIRGARVEMNVSLKGRSGLNHKIDIVAVSPDANDVKLYFIIPFLSVREVLRIATISMDFKDVKVHGREPKIIIVSNSLEPGSKELADSLGLTVITLEGVGTPG